MSLSDIFSGTVFWQRNCKQPTGFKFRVQGERNGSKEHDEEFIA